MGGTYGSTRQAGPTPLLDVLVHSAHDAIYTVDPHFIILTWNPAAETLLGWAAGEIVGRSADLLVPPDRRGDQREMLTLIEAGARLERFRTQRRHRDGRWILVTLTMSPLFDDGRLLGLTVIARAVGDRERLESSLQALLEAAPDAFVGVGDDDVIALANTQAEQLFGETRTGLIGRPIGDLLSAPLSEPVPVPGSELDPEATPTLARRRDGSTVPVEVSVSILPTDEGQLRCAVIRDITERVRAEEGLRQLRAEAERARLDAQLQRTQRLEGLGQLAGGVAHDFNNLIAVIANYATFIAESAADAGLDEIAGDAAQITKAAQRGADLTHQLLAFARREVVRPRPLNLNDVVLDIEQILRRSIGEHITLSVHLAEVLPAVTADPGQIDQVLVNLAVNARDAMPRGGDLSIETGLVDVDDDYASGRPHLHTRRYVRLRVSDTGTGMPPEVIERAFEPFYTTKPAGQGTGLGLATVYGIVTAAGGDLHIYSEQGMGTTFTILLPATDAAPTTVEQPAEVTLTGARRGTILAVEDEPALRGVLHRILLGAGHEVLIAEDGLSALALAEAHEGPIDLLLTDVVMPHMLGRDLADRLTEQRPDTKVLFMSGYARPALASQGTLAPGVTLVEKPFSKIQLLTAIQNQLQL
ncbi:MAG TPA: PAS domain S-box protein [Actinoplanes sp.]|nr:PAS domain S-box protein [Actinoplanes sp.]